MMGMFDDLKTPRGMFDDPTQGMSTGEKFAAGMGKAVSDLWLGLRQRTSEIAPSGGLGGGYGSEPYVPRPEDIKAEIEDTRRRDAPLMQTTAGKVGHFAGNVAVAAPTILIPGANTMTGAALIGGVQNALQPTDTPGQAAINTLMGAGMGAGGQIAGKALGRALDDWFQGAKVAAAARAAKNAPRDMTIVEGRAAGYTFPPSMLPDAPVGKAVEGLAGKPAVAQRASIAHQNITNALIRQGLGIPADVPIGRDVLNGVRREAGQAFEALRNTGTVTADKTYLDALDKLGAKYASAAKDFPEVAGNEIGELVGSLRKPSFNASSAVDVISVLRDRADTAFRNGQGALGNAAKQAANALEDQLERHLTAIGAPADLLNAYRGARTTIAKSYAVQDALNEATGNVSAQRLGDAYKRGAPFSGPLETVAKMGANFRKAVAPPESFGGEVPLTYMDVLKGMAGGVGGSWLGGPVGGTLGAAVGTGARVAGPRVLLSGPYQNLVARAPTYAPSEALRLTDLLLGGDRGAIVGRLFGPAAVVEARQE